MSSSGLRTLLLLLGGIVDFDLVTDNKVSCFGKKGGTFSLLSNWPRRRTAIARDRVREKGRRDGGEEVGGAGTGIYNSGSLEGKF